MTRILRGQKEQLRAGFQDHLVMTASITLHVYIHSVALKSDLGKRREQQERTNKNIQFSKCENPL